MPQLITNDIIKRLLPIRARQAHKGNFGRVLIIAGSIGMMGAAVLCARAALRSGAGLVTVACDKEFFPVVHHGIPEATCRDLNLDGEELNKYDAIAIGPGLGVSQKTADILYLVLGNYTGPVVLDADALNVIAVNKELCKESLCTRIMTPHEGEAARLLNKTTKQISEHREEAAKAIAIEYSAVCVLKGSGTLIATPGIELYITTTGNPGMATGGSGDVRTGMIVSFAAQFRSDPQKGILHAALAGVYLHGLSGDLASAELGEYGLIAGDIAAYIPYAINEIMVQPITQ